VSVEEREASQQHEKVQKKVALELIFISFIGLVVIGGFVVALGYDFVSARAPLVIMVPLLILIAYQFNKTRRKAENHVIVKHVSLAFKGRDPEFNSVARFIGFMSLLLLLIWLAGHYVGISVFMFVLLYWISREHPILSLLIAVGVTVLIYFLFEHGFNIELYRGYIFRLLSRYEWF